MENDVRDLLLAAPPETTDELMERIKQIGFVVPEPTHYNPQGYPHKVLTCDGWHPAGCGVAGNQARLCFSEREAVGVFWWHFCTTMDLFLLDGDMTLDAVYWRELPEHSVHYGRHNIYGRLSMAAHRADVDRGLMVRLNWDTMAFETAKLIAA